MAWREEQKTGKGTSWLALIPAGLLVLYALLRALI